MQMSEVLASLDAEIQSLRRARALLVESDGDEDPPKRGRGRPRKVDALIEKAIAEKPAARRGRPPRNA